MRYTLLIVDDEYQIREGSAVFIREAFPQLDVFTAENGIDALDVIHNNHVDAMLLDINMRKMNGLALLECLSKESYSIITVIISGYSDFQFAQQAIRHGVKKYLIKPFTPNVMKETIKELIENIKEYRERKTELNLLRYRIRQGCKALRDELFWQWISGFIDDRFFLAQCDCLELKFDKEYYQVAVINIDTQDFIKKELMVSGICQYMESVPVPDMKIFQTPEGISILFGIDETDAKSYCSVLEELLRTNDEKDLTIGLGPPSRGIHGIIESHKLAVFACRNRIVMGNESVLCSWLLNQQESIGIVFDAAAFTLALAICNREQAMKYIHDSFELLTKRTSINASHVESLSMMIYSSCVNAYGNYGRMKSYDFFMNEVLQIEEIEKLEKWLIDLVNDWMNVTEQTGLFGTPQSLKRLRSYILENYEKELTVQSLSEIFKANPDYLGKVFKREFGETINECINSTRIKASVDLLLHTEKTVLEIAFETGFRDQTYYSTVFKRMLGVSPSRFRELRLYDNEKEIMGSEALYSHPHQNPS